MHFILSQIIPEVLVNAPVSLTTTQFASYYTPGEKT